MKWSAFIILGLLTAAVQATAGAVLRVSLGGGLLLTVDFLAILAVLSALRARGGSDAVLAGWVLGLLIDLALRGTPLGLYALAFGLCAGAVYRVRGAVFTGNPVSQMVMTFVFCLGAHGSVELFIAAAMRPPAGRLGLDLLQALLLAVCSATAAPAMMALVRKLDWLILTPRGQRRR